ncbi:MAG: hypothetical protein M3R49_09845 [Chloroflexota bacterium]|nr:hypothetical protein [Chloroflexota bacterium]MDQ2935256.1 hypothetical protein [Chloroflexota bacterium]
MTRILYKTARVPAISRDMSGMGAPAQQGVAWFELVLHEGPPNDNTWEGGGQTIVYWRDQFARKKDPYPWTIEASGMEGVAPAIMPDRALEGLPDDARISFLWTFVPAELAGKNSVDV